MRIKFCQMLDVELLSYCEDIAEIDGKLYVLRSDLFGNVTGRYGPFDDYEDADREQLKRFGKPLEPSECDCTCHQQIADLTPVATPNRAPAQSNRKRPSRLVRRVTTK